MELCEDDIKKARKFPGFLSFRNRSLFFFYAAQFVGETFKPFYDIVQKVRNQFWWMGNVMKPSLSISFESGKAYFISWELLLANCAKLLYPSFLETPSRFLWTASTESATMNGSMQPFFITSLCIRERLLTAIHCGTLCIFKTTHKNQWVIFVNLFQNQP